MLIQSEVNFQINKQHLQQEDLTNHDELRCSRKF
jgi:hypothetical protein